MGLEQRLPKMYSCIHTVGLPENRCYLCQSELLGNFKPIGSAGSGMSTTGNKNISQTYDFKEAVGYGLKERYDLSRHKDDLTKLPTKPHLNVTVDNLNKFNKFGETKPAFGSGTSKKSDDLHDDYLKGLGKAHHIDLWEKK